MTEKEKVDPEEQICSQAHCKWEHPLWKTKTKTKTVLLENTNPMKEFPEHFPMTWHYFSWVDSSLASCVPILGWKPHRWVRKGTPPIPMSKEAVWAALFNKESPCVPFSWKEFIRKSLMKINVLLKWAFYLIPHQLAGKQLGGGKQISCWIQLT